jgi:hypothetical protein
MPHERVEVEVPSAVAAAMRARALADGHSLEDERVLALREHVGQQRLAGEMLHVDDVVRGDGAW